MKNFFAIAMAFLVCHIYVLGAQAPKFIEDATKKRIHASLTGFIDFGLERSKDKNENGMVKALINMRTLLAEHKISIEAYLLANKIGQAIARDGEYKLLYDEAYFKTEKLATINKEHQAAFTCAMIPKVFTRWNAFRKKGAELLRVHAQEKFKIVFPNGYSEKERLEFFDRYKSIDSQDQVIEIQAKIIALHQLQEIQDQAMRRLEIS